jgi:hypothetical protein
MRTPADGASLWRKQDRGKNGIAEDRKPGFREISVGVSEMHP